MPPKPVLNKPLRVAVHDAPFRGRATTSGILRAVRDGALHDIEVVKTLKNPGPVVLLFTAAVAAYPDRADGLLVIRPGGVAPIQVSEPIPATNTPGTGSLTCSLPAGT